MANAVGIAVDFSLGFGGGGVLLDVHEAAQVAIAGADQQRIIFS